MANDGGFYSSVRQGGYLAPAVSVGTASVDTASAGPAVACESRWTGSAVKRLVDIFGALAIALVLSPVILAISCVMLRSTGRPLLFTQKRVGKNGALFKVYKFRSMVPNAEEVLKHLLETNPAAREEWNRDQKLRNDPRVTRAGKLLRQTSLDELPQLLNVLRGEMSLVGPRPVVPVELIRYGRGARYYLAVKPGLTGFWQVAGRNDTEYSRRIAFDRKYLEHSSFWFDAFILLRTVWVMVFQKGAY